MRHEIRWAITGEHRNNAFAGKLRHTSTRRFARAADVREQHCVRRGEQVPPPLAQPTAKA